MSGTPVDSYGNVVLPSREELAAGGITQEDLDALEQIGKRHNQIGTPRLSALDQEALRDIVALWKKTGQTPTQDIHNHIQAITGHSLVSPEQWEEQEGPAWYTQAFHRLGWFDQFWQLDW